MESTHDNRLMDTVLTLRGHQITLRQAIAEGIIKGNFDPESGRADVKQVQADWFIDRAKQRDDA